MSIPLPPSPEQMFSPVYSNKCSDWAQASRAEYQEYLNTLRQMRRDLRRVERVIRRLEKNVALDSRRSCSGRSSLGSGRSSSSDAMPGRRSETPKWQGPVESERLSGKWSMNGTPGSSIHRHQMVGRNLTKTSMAPLAELARQKTPELSDGVQVPATDPPPSGFNINIYFAS